MPYLLWGVFELACARPYFKMFVISKVVGLYFLAAEMCIRDSRVELLAVYGNRLAFFKRNRNILRLVGRLLR